MSIDPRLIIRMIAVEKYGSISRAAAALRISQPALSKGIDLLERRLGVRLLERSRHGSKLTEYGEAVAHCANLVEAQIKRLVEEVRSRSAGGAGVLNIGITPFVGSTFVPKAIADLLLQMPSLTTLIMEAPDDQLTEMLLDGQIDLSIGPIGGKALRADIKEQALFIDPFCVVVRKGHRLAKKRLVSVSDVINEKLILPHAGGALRRQIEAIFVSSGHPVPGDSVNTNSTRTTETLLLHTNSVAIMPSCFVYSLEAQKFSGVVLRDVSVLRTIGVKKLSQVQLSPPANALLTILKQHANLLKAPPARSRTISSRPPQRRERRRP